jgi:hypothetical protein
VVPDLLLGWFLGDFLRGFLNGLLRSLFHGFLGSLAFVEVRRRGSARDFHVGDAGAVNCDFSVDVDYHAFLFVREQPDHQLALRIEFAEQLRDGSDRIGRVLRRSRRRFIEFVIVVIVIVRIFVVIVVIVVGFRIFVVGIAFGVLFGTGVFFGGLVGRLAFAGGFSSELCFELRDTGFELRDLGVCSFGVLVSRRESVVSGGFFRSDIVGSGIFLSSSIFRLFGAFFLLLVLLGFGGNRLVQRLLPEAKSQFCLLFRVFCHCSDSFC